MPSRSRKKSKSKRSKVRRKSTKGGAVPMKLITEQAKNLQKGVQKQVQQGAQRLQQEVHKQLQQGTQRLKQVAQQVTTPNATHKQGGSKRRKSKRNSRSKKRSPKRVSRSKKRKSHGGAVKKKSPAKKTSKSPAKKASKSKASKSKIVKKVIKHSASRAADVERCKQYHGKSTECRSNDCWYDYDDDQCHPRYTKEELEKMP